MSVALSVVTQVAGTSVLPCIADPPLFVSLARMTVVIEPWDCSLWECCCLDSKEGVQSAISMLQLKSSSSY